MGGRQISAFRREGLFVPFGLDKQTVIFPGFDGGLVFIGATLYDYKFRAFDGRTGKLLWETQLPYAGRATPATYMVDGKQYVVIATGAADTRLLQRKVFTSHSYSPDQLCGHH